MLQLDTRQRELIAKVRIIREGLVRNRGEVRGGKPDKTYVWVHNSSDRLTFFQGLGFSVCKDPDVKTAWKRSDGTHVRGDLILMEVPKELKEAYDLEAQVRSLEGIQSGLEGFLEFAARQGIPATDETRR